MPRGGEVAMQVANSSLGASSQSKTTGWAEQLGGVFKYGPIEHDTICGPQIPLKTNCYGGSTIHTSYIVNSDSYVMQFMKI
jgi:hypothetical protein